MVIVTVSSGLSTGERVDFSQRARCRCLKHVGITEHRAGQWLMTLGRFHGVGRECLVDTRLVPAEGVENRLRQMREHLKAKKIHLLEWVFRCSSERKVSSPRFW